MLAPKPAAAQYFVSKRILDVAFAALTLVLLSPVTALELGVRLLAALGLVGYATQFLHKRRGAVFWSILFSYPVCLDIGFSRSLRAAVIGSR